MILSQTSRSLKIPNINKADCHFESGVFERSTAFTDLLPIYLLWVRGLLPGARRAYHLLSDGQRGLSKTRATQCFLHSEGHTFPPKAIRDRPPTITLLLYFIYFRFEPLFAGGCLENKIPPAPRYHVTKNRRSEPARKPIRFHCLMSDILSLFPQNSYPFRIAHSFRNNKSSGIFERRIIPSLRCGGNILGIS